MMSISALRQKLGTFWVNVKLTAACYWHQLVHYSYIKWLYWKPKLDKVVRATIAIFTATSIFRVSIGIAPIILSVLTVLATAPLFNYILPNFAFTPFFIMPLLIAVSCVAGYFKYRELVIRARLDHQIEANQQQILRLQERIAKLEKNNEDALKDKHIAPPQNDPVHPIQFLRPRPEPVTTPPPPDPNERTRARAS